MSLAPRALICAAVLAACAASATAAPAAPLTVSRLALAPSAAAGPPPSLTFVLREPGARTVYAKVAITSLATRALLASLPLGWVHTGRAVLVRWPAALRLAPGSYHVSIHAHDAAGAALLRTHAASGVATLTVAAPAQAPGAVVLAPAAATPAGVSALPGVPSPAQTLALGAVFPVAGAHSFGGPENRFGAPREGGYVHEGQDVLAAEGTAVVAPLPGTVTWTSYQAGGAGYYAVEHTSVGLDLMFAHCQAGTLAVAAGAALAAGQPLCDVGQTGDATAPHLHLELWSGGWQAAGGRPIDPLPYLEAWEAAAGGPAASG